MSRYRQRRSSNWSLSTTAVGWMLATGALLMVAFFFIGAYVGHSWGVETGQREARRSELELNDQMVLNYIQDERLSDQSEAQLVEFIMQRTEQASQSGASGDTGEESQGYDLSRALTEEDISLGEGEGNGNEDQSLDEFQPNAYENNSNNTSNQQSDENDPLAQLQNADTERTTISPGGPGNSGNDQADTSSDSPIDEVDEQPSPDNVDGPQLPTSSVEPENEDANLGEKFGRSDPFYTVQVLSTTNREAADRVSEQFHDRGHEVAVTQVNIEGEQYFRVRVGSFSSREEATQYAEDMVAAGEIKDNRYWVSHVTP